MTEVFYAKKEVVNYFIYKFGAKESRFLTVLRV